MPLPTAAYGAVVYASGVSTVDTNEPASFLSGTNPNEVFQVTAAAKRVWDPTVAVTVKDNGTTLTPGTQYTFNYLFGRIQFVSYTPTTPVTVTGQYLPLVEAVLASKFEINIKQTLVDDTNFDTGGAVHRVATLTSYEGMISTFDIGNTVLDGVAGTWESWLLNATPKVMSILLGTGNSYFRTWALFESMKNSGAVAGVFDTGINWKSIISAGQAATFGWGT